MGIILIFFAQFFPTEIMISTPEKGYREVYYESLSDDSNKVFEDWRLEIVRALPSPTSDKRKKSSQDRLPLHLKLPRADCSLFRVRYAEDCLHSILDVLNGGKTRWSVLDAYLMLILDQYDHHRPSSERTLRSTSRKSTEVTPTYRLLSVRFLPVKNKNQCLETLKPNIKFPPITPVDSDNLILLAPQHAHKHLYLAVLDFDKKLAQVFDSCWHHLPMKVRQEQVQTVVKLITPNWKEWRVHFTQKCSQQPDKYSCGVFVIYFAQNIMRALTGKNCKKVGKTEVARMRMQICRELLSTTAHGRAVLGALTE